MPIAADILKKAKFWAEAAVFDPKTRQEVQALIDAQDEAALSERFYKDLSFGTAGMRGLLGAGAARMNVYNVRRATFAVGSYLRDEFKDQKLAVAISYDCRHGSQAFAQAAAGVLASMGIRSYLTERLGPVPLLSFMVRHLGCYGGIYITASHNPPAYNGYKVYLKTGGQIVPPADSKITEIYDRAQYEEIDFVDPLNSELVESVGEEILNAYLEKLDVLDFNQNGQDLKVVYTPLHGTGSIAVPAALSRFGFKRVELVEAQTSFDGDFPTVASPNPGEPDSLKMAISLADASEADLILATDPDSDRIGVAVRNRENVFEHLEGNALGSLLIDYVLSEKQRLGSLEKNALVIKTIVTTELQTAIANSYGAHMEETLTGFKWIAERIDQYESGQRLPYRNYICGGEEAYGFLADHFVRDKDGVSACCIAAQMAAKYKEKGMTLFEAMDQLYIKYGYYLERLKTVKLEGAKGAAKIESMMTQLRDNKPERMAGLDVTRVRDFLEGVDTSGAIFEFPTSNVLQFYLGSQVRLSIRPSGTEPLIKYYLSVSAPADDTHSLEAAKRECASVETSIWKWLDEF